MKSCPCYSGRPYAECCKPYHDGAAAQSAEALMRSRYAAYALGLVDYIMETTHPSFRESPQDPWRQQLEQFCRSTRFTGLKVLDAQERAVEATVQFHAGLRQGARDVSFTELSRFQRIAGRWYYQDAIG